MGSLYNFDIYPPRKLYKIRLASKPSFPGDLFLSIVFNASSHSFSIKSLSQESASSKDNLD